MNDYKTHSEEKQNDHMSVLNPHLSKNSVVLCGSWSGHKDERVLLETFGGKVMDLKFIPPKTIK